MRGPQQDMVIFEVRDVLRVFLGDHLNTIRDVVDTSGTIVNHLTIDSFGKRITETNGNIEVMIGLGGRPYDEVTGIQNHVNRPLPSRHRPLDVRRPNRVCRRGLESEPVRRQ